MNYTIQIDVRDDNDNLIKIIRGNDLSSWTTDHIDTDVKGILDDMTFKTRNIRDCLELLEQYIDDHADSMAYSEQAIEDRRTLKKAIEELEALL
jgi:hypothetical protein